MSDKMTVNFHADRKYVEKFDEAWRVVGYHNRTEVFHEKMREIIEKAKET